MTNASDTGGFLYAFGGDTPLDTLKGFGLLVLAVGGAAMIYTGLQGAGHALLDAALIMTGAVAGKVGLTTGF